VNCLSSNLQPDAGQSPTLAHPAASLAACIRHPSTETNKNWLLWQRPLRDQKTNSRLITYSRISTNLANLAKIHPIDFEVIGVTENVEKINK